MKEKKMYCFEDAVRTWIAREYRTARVTSTVVPPLCTAISLVIDAGTLGNSTANNEAYCDAVRTWIAREYRTARVTVSVGDASSAQCAVTAATEAEAERISERARVIAEVIWQVAGY